jgi:hypothetical protein
VYSDCKCTIEGKDTERSDKMSFNTIFSTYEDIINFLKNKDYPQCFTVNYRPKYDDYEIWIGNQPYENYEKMIEDLDESLHIARVGRRDLIAYVKQLKEELIEAYQKRGDMYMAGEKESIDERIKELKN